MLVEGFSADLFRVLGAVLFLAGGTIIWLGRRLDAGCPSCSHCAAIREVEEARRKAEEERLFGRRLTEEELAQRIEEASRHADGDQDES